MCAGSQTPDLVRVAAENALRHRIFAARGATHIACGLS
jgi:hypothetical protein